ncbi:uncharacterized protein LOC121375616 [Gigantopelta aegis]|uniref:uncharacterized protein LOC121375616 n=1 Tax=Gigantopelta aegis TaxID=1735272 RepID=UPI001B88AFDD|nr:uncharacterized protein LOC121375616 [Gigantopelta aegis]
MDTHDSKVTPDEDKIFVNDSSLPPDALICSAGSTSVIVNTVNPSQLGYMVVTSVNNKPETNEEHKHNSDMSFQLENALPTTVVDLQHDRDTSESEQQGLSKKRSQTSSDTNPYDKRPTSIEGTPKRARSSSKGNGANPNRRPRSKSESGTSSDVFDSFSVEDTLRHLSGSVTPDSADASFKNAPVSSMLEDVLTEKKLSLLRSPEVIQFLQKQQVQKVRENRISMG